MKTILCYGASNVWGFIPGSWDAQLMLAKRYVPDERWTGVLQRELGNEYFVVEEGLNGRTTTYDDTVAQKPYRNGLTQLPICLEGQYPIDLVIFMLGTNDVKVQYGKSVEEITKAMQQLIKVVKQSNKGPEGLSPKVLLIAPQPIVKTAGLSSQFDDDSIRKSIELAAAYRKLAIEEGCVFLDSSEYVTSSKIDGIHLDRSQLAPLGHAVAGVVNQLFLH